MVLVLSMAAPNEIFLFLQRRQVFLAEYFIPGHVCFAVIHGRGNGGGGGGKDLHLFGGGF